MEEVATNNATTDDLQAEPAMKKVKTKPLDDTEPIPVEQAAAEEGVLAASSTNNNNNNNHLHHHLHNHHNNNVVNIKVDADAQSQNDSSVHSQNNSVMSNHTNNNNKRSFSAQVDLSNKHPTDPNNFNDYLFALLAHKAETQNFHVTREDNANLHTWLQHLKREYKNHLSEEGGASSSSLTEAQVKVLEHLHVPLTSRGDDHWNRFYQLLQAYADRHGHVLVPRLCEIPGLGDWVTDQRRQVRVIFIY